MFTVRSRRFTRVRSGAGGGAGPGEPPDSASEASGAAQQPASEDAPFLKFFRKTEIAGTADMYFHYNFNEPATGSLTPLRNFDVEHNQFSFALAEIVFNKAATSDDRVGFRFDFDYGPVTDWVHPPTPKATRSSSTHNRPISAIWRRWAAD